jgi:hypothetical protein
MVLFYARVSEQVTGVIGGVSVVAGQRHAASRLMNQ